MQSSIKDDPFDLRRFVDAQEDTYLTARRELVAGEKQSHWMWFIFPQIRGLGKSPTAQHFAISGLPEAKAYLNHPLLGLRLRECTQLVIDIRGHMLEDIFGFTDQLKFQSSMTLFAQAAKGSVLFTQALQKYCGGEFDSLTMKALSTHIA